MTVQYLNIQKLIKVGYVSCIMLQGDGPLIQLYFSVALQITGLLIAIIYQPFESKQVVLN